MVLTVTLNPLLEKRLFFKKITLGNGNRSLKMIYTAGGKGINVSRQLNKLGIQNLALTFLGGGNGKKLRSILETENINHAIVSSKSETRFAALAIEEKANRLTTFFSPNSEITQKEAEDFIQKLEKIIKNNSIVVFSGSSPNKFTDQIFPAGIELARKYDKFCILDTYGNHLKKCLEKGPDVFHGNVSEIENSLDVSLSNVKLKEEFMDYLYSKGIKLSFITDGENNGYAAKFNFHYKITNAVVNEIDSTGSGDAFVAGIAYGLEKALVFEDFTKFASALGAANAAKWEVCNSTFEEAEKVINEIKVSPIGKKMKLIDDSPTI